MRKGFTLIEMLLVMGVLGVMSSLSIPLLRSYQIRNDLALAKNQITQGLERTKLLAQSGHQDAKWSFYVPEGILFQGGDYTNYDPSRAERYPMPSNIKTSGLTQVTYDWRGVPDVTGEIFLSALSGETDSITVTIFIDNQTVATTIGDSLTICHQIPGGGQETILITDSTWPSHQAHGDTIGTCASASSLGASSSVSSSQGVSSSVASSVPASSAASSAGAASSSSDAGGTGGTTGGDAGGGGASSGSSAPAGTACLPASGLAGHWAFDESAGAATATDGSGYGHHGTLVNLSTSSSWTTDRPASFQADNPRALAFNGTNGTVNAGHPAGLNDIPVKTVTAWIKPNVAGQIARIMDKTRWFVDLESPNALTYYQYLTDGNIAMWRTPTNSITMGTWNHVAVVYDRQSTGNVPAFYINGVLQQLTTMQAPTAGPLGDASYDLTIGNRGAGDRGFKDVMDDVRIYSRALTGGEIALLAAGSCSASSSSNSGPACTDSSGLVGYWKMDDGPGSTVAVDSGGYGATATLQNMQSTAAWSSTVAPMQFPNDRSLSFNGGNNRVLVGKPNQLNNIDVKTIAAWIRPTSYGGGGYGHILDKQDTAAYNLGWMLFLNNNYGTDVARLKYNHSFQEYTASWQTPPNSVPLNQWTHVAVVYDRRSTANHAQIYLNGVAQPVDRVSAGVGAAANDALSNLYIGNRANPDRGFAGFIDDVRIYSRALPPSEIQTIAAGRCLAPPVTSSGLCPQKFTINAANLITLAAASTVTFRNLESKITFGSGGPPIPVHACYSTNAGSSFTHLFGGNGTCTGNGVANGNAVKPNGIDTKTESIAAGSQLVVRINGRYKQQGWLAFDQTYQTNDQSGHIALFRDGDALPAYTTFGGQQSLKQFLTGQAMIDAEGKLNIGPCEVLLVTELGALNASSADFQDDVMLVQFN
ncbi:MAG: peptidase S8/S53 subtilisin kexin sedolisin [Candidatus Peregrinibacteria bacterium Greene0416_19]|nr:MAG: peptidase S8/S53 subtilisin kexin sedolisin [Candidatus Peregrinibacteria bacterium Greene0416_19]